MEILLSVISILYIIFILLLIRGWLQIEEEITISSSSSQTFSVIIPVRNEATTIISLLRDLEAQNYDNGRYEIIVVDDHSTDNTYNIVSGFKGQFDLSISILQLGKKEGKKEALSLGISKSKHQTILTIDGDCRVAANWIASYAATYDTSDAELIFGPVTFLDENRLFHKLQEIEFASLVGSGAASIGLGQASMCNGANFSFKKELYNTVGGYSSHLTIPSGDDEFFMHQVFKEKPSSIHFLKNKAAIVFTTSASGFTQFVAQRKRWASKWGKYRLIFPKILAIVVLLFQMFFLTIPFLKGLNEDYLILVSIIWLSKLILDSIFIEQVMNFLGKRMNLIHYFILSFIYVIYVPLFAVIGSWGTYKWKDRVHE